MNSYHITWVIEYDAETPEAAARAVFEKFFRPGHGANVFDCIGADGVEVRVDLMELAQAQDATQPPKRRVQHICAECKSAEIYYDATSQWCDETQTYVLSDTQDHAYCGACDTDNADLITVDADTGERLGQDCELPGLPWVPIEQANASLARRRAQINAERESAKAMMLAAQNAEALAAGSFQ